MDLFGAHFDHPSGQMRGRVILSRQRFPVFGVVFLFIAIALTIAIYFFIFSKKDGDLTVTFVGDTALGLEKPARDAIEKMGVDASFTFLKKSLENSDYVIANLETPIASEEIQKAADSPNPRQRKYAAGALRRTGVDAVSLANNHTMDFKDAGLQSTLSALKRQRIKVFGAGKNSKQARKPLIIEKNGVRVGVLGYSLSTGSKRNKFAGSKKAGINPFRPKRLEKDIADLKKKVDVVVLFVHWGDIFKDIDLKMRGFARESARAGADLIVGHHPHIPLPVEFEQSTPVVYSVGNFVFHGLRGDGLHMDPKTSFSIVVHLDIREGKPRTLRMIPFFNDNMKTDFIPRPVGESTTRALFKRLLRPIKGSWTIKGDEAVIDLSKKPKPKKNAD